MSNSLYGMHLYIICGNVNVFPPDWTDLVPSPLEQNFRQDLLEKMLKDHVEVAVFIAISCFV